jgi:hypothetical protein
MMKNLIKRTLFALALASAIPVAMAQPQAGDWEFTLGGGGDTDTDFDRGGFGVNGSFGYFYTPNFEIGVRQNLNFAGRTADEEWSGSTRLALDYHFLLGRFVPFIGGSFGIDYNEDDDVWGIGPEVGVKYYVHEKTFLFVLGEYRWLFDRLSQADNRADDGRFAVTFGVGFNIGGGRR